MRIKQRGLFIVISVILLMWLTGCGKKTVALDDYIKVSATGYDSIGTAEVSLDYKKFEKDYGKKIKFNKKESRHDFVKEHSLKSSMDDSKLLLDTCVQTEIDNDKHLSNGDVINVKVSCDEELAKEYFGVKLNYSDIEYEVDGLEEVDKFNPFDYITVEFSGTSPYVNAHINEDSGRKELKDIYFEAEKNSNIKLGEEVEVRAKQNISNREFVEKYGSIISETSKKYKCEGVDFYIKSTTDIPENSMNELISAGESKIRDYINDNWSKPENLISIKYEGNYVLSLKEDNTTWGLYDNYVYMVYKIQATNPDPVENVEYYDYVCFSNLILSTKGEWSFGLGGYTQKSDDFDDNSSFMVGNYRYGGYKDLKSLMYGEIVPNLDNYNYTTTLSPN